MTRDLVLRILYTNLILTSLILMDSYPDVASWQRWIGMAGVCLFAIITWERNRVYAEAQKQMIAAGYRLPPADKLCTKCGKTPYEWDFDDEKFCQLCFEDYCSLLEVPD